MDFIGNWTLETLLDKYDELTELISKCRADKDYDGIAYYLNIMYDLINKMNGAFYKEKRINIFQ